MADFPSATREAVERLYTSGAAWVENLEQCNERAESVIREEYLRTLLDLLQEIDDAGFHDKTDFADTEQNAIIVLANEVAAVTSHVKAQNDLTLCEIETDLADLTQRIALGGLLGLLRSRWGQSRRQYPKLPREVPDEVCDAYSVGIFTRCEYMLSRLAKDLKPVANEQCLNPDDYSNVWFLGMELKAAHLSSQETIDGYIQLQIDKQNAQLAAKLEEGPSVGGLIWDLIGWDDPWDFVKDMALFSITGGASKVFRWGRRLNTARKEVKKVTRTLRKLEGAIAKAEKRWETARNTAQAIKRTKALAEIPNRIRKALRALAIAKASNALITDAGHAVTGDVIRGVITSVNANLAVNKASKSVSVQASYEMARMSAIAALEKIPPFTRIPALRRSIGFAVLFRTKGTGSHDALIGQYVAYVWLQEFVVRIVLAVLHQSNLVFDTVNQIAGDRSKSVVTVKMAEDEAIAALGAAIERIWRDDLTFLPEVLGEQLANWARAFARKALVELIQKLVDLASSR